MKSYDWEGNKASLTDSTGKRLTTGLFKELADPSSAARPIFTLEEWRVVYVELADAGEYAAAMALIGNWEHWQALLRSPPFMVELEKWRVEVAAKLQSEGIAHLRRQARTDKGVAAAKWLAERGFEEKQRGRPRKEQPQAQSDSHQVGRDARRLGLVPGGKAA